MIELTGSDEGWGSIAHPSSSPLRSSCSGSAMPTSSGSASEVWEAGRSCS